MKRYAWMLMLLLFAAGSARGQEQLVKDARAMADAARELGAKAQKLKAVPLAEIEAKAAALAHSAQIKAAPLAEYEAKAGALAQLEQLSSLKQLEKLSALSDMAKFSYASSFALSGGLGQGMSFALAQSSDRAERTAEREYQRGLKALDQRKWDEAIGAFREVGKPRGDAALYWTAFAQNKLGRRDQALQAIQTLLNTYPGSAWLNDARALELEVKHSAGQPVSPESETDDDLKLMAINSLMNSDPERSLPLLEGLLKRASSPQLKERALFVLSQNRSPKAREIVLQIAKGASNPDLQRRAIRNLGIHGGKENRQALMEIYPTASTEIKRDILQSFMTSGERDYLLNVAKTDQNPELRRQAIHWLGTMGAQSTLADLYGSESSTEVRSSILHAMFISGNSDKLLEIARTEKDQKLRLDAIHKLGTMGREKTGDALASLYTSDADVDVRKRILHALFIQNSAKHLVDIARKETNLDLKKQAVHWLSLTKSKEATDYLMELLK